MTGKAILAALAFAAGAQFGTYMNEHGIPTEILLEPGDHGWKYWRRALVAIADWHAKRFSYHSP